MLGRIVRVVGFAIPFCVSTVVVSFAAGLYRPSDDAGATATVAWIAALLVIGIVTAVVAERLVRPLFPLASLLQMALLFPDRAPSRTLTALRSGSVRNARHLLDDPTTPATERDAAAHILGLVAALSRHDRITRGHCERVRTYADLMAAQLDLDPYDAERLRWAALLHDIGKLRVAYATLNKTGKLDDHEWEAIRRHPQDGAELVAPLAAWLGPWADAVAQHHERFDGTGYPNRLAGSDINLGGRIIAVVDAFDVMTASRSYKRPITSSAARRELQRCAGTQFDPTVVDAFLAIPAERAGWYAGLIGSLGQLARIRHLTRLPSPVTATVNRIPIASTAAASTASTATAIGAVSLGLVAAASMFSGSTAAVADPTGAVSSPAPTVASVVSEVPSSTAAPEPPPPSTTPAVGGQSEPVPTAAPTTSAATVPPVAPSPPPSAAPAPPGALQASNAPDATARDAAARSAAAQAKAEKDKADKVKADKAEKDKADKAEKDKADKAEKDKAAKSSRAPSRTLSKK